MAGRGLEPLERGAVADRGTMVGRMTVVRAGPSLLVVGSVRSGDGLDEPPSRADDVCATRLIGATEGADVGARPAWVGEGRTTGMEDVDVDLRKTVAVDRAEGLVVDVARDGT
jgi:hypothetical protein